MPLFAIRDTEFWTFGSGVAFGVLLILAVAAVVVAFRVSGRR